MKNLIYKIFSRLFRERLEMDRYDYYDKRRTDDEVRKLVINFPIGTKVISQSNEPEAMIIGSVIGHISSGYNNTVKVRTKSGRDLIILGTLAYYTKERENTLRKLDWAERYNVMSKYYGISDSDKKRMEKRSYLKRALTADDLGELRVAKGKPNSSKGMYYGRNRLDVALLDKTADRTVKQLTGKKK